MLTDAHKEMTLISGEKKEYLLKWKSSVIAMSKRDEAMQAAQRELDLERQKMQTVEMEIQGLKKAIGKEQDEVLIYCRGYKYSVYKNMNKCTKILNWFFIFLSQHEKLRGVLTKLQSDQAFVQQQSAIGLERKQKMSEQLTVLKATLIRHDTDLAASTANEVELKSQVKYRVFIY